MDSVVEVRKILDNLLPDVEQVIKVPKILPHTVPQRSSLQEPQTAEQLVAVPVIERIVVARGRGAGGVAWCHTAGWTWLVRVHDTGWEPPPGQGGT